MVLEDTTITTCRAGLSLQPGQQAIVATCTVSQCRNGIITKGGVTHVSNTLVELCTGTGVWVVAASDENPMGTRFYMRSTHVLNNRRDGVRVHSFQAYARIGNACHIEGNGIIQGSGVVVFDRAHVHITSAHVEAAGQGAMAAVVVVDASLRAINSTLRATDTASGCAVLLHRPRGTHDDTLLQGNDFPVADTMRVGFALPDWFDIAAVHGWNRLLQLWELSGLVMHHAFEAAPDIWYTHTCMLVLFGHGARIGRPHPDIRPSFSCWEISNEVLTRLQLLGACTGVSDAQLLEVLPIDWAAIVVLLASCYWRRCTQI